MTEHVHHTMDQRIFNMNLSVVATSAYIVVTSLLGDNAPPTLENVRGRWTVSPEELDLALGELFSRGVLERREGPGGEILLYPRPSSLWR